MPGAQQKKDMGAGGRDVPWRWMSVSLAISAISRWQDPAMAVSSLRFGTCAITSGREDDDEHG